MRLPTTVALSAFLVLVQLAVPPPGADAHRRHRRRESHAPVGRFDYYVLSLSWSPQHCAEEDSVRDDLQCHGPRHYGFVVHGLWPQYDDGGYPHDCATSDRLPPSVIDRMLELMPSRDLIRHEWRTHGTCSGLTPDAYFARVRDAFGTFVVPARYREPETAFRVTAADLREELRRTNPSLRDGNVAVICKGHFLGEIRVCLAKSDLTLRDCDRTVRDDCHGAVTVRPVR